MTRKHYDKLIRDRIPEIIADTGNSYEVSMMAEDEFERALRAKLVEEATELQAAPSSELLSEFADLMEVVDTLLRLHDITWEQLKQQQNARRLSRGGFSKRLNLLWTE